MFTLNSSRAYPGFERIQSIRQKYPKEKLEIRVDANGAFAFENAMEKLQKLSELDIHSIEQPIKAGNWEQMKTLCAKTPLPIALDEELIGVGLNFQMLRR